mmetsp:Transcript_26760/g.66189  ORF Transcript_26760/g.66189 Transcript_26760/m.66189 type:complete len:199 (+) Transcript_26760:16-612(+)
MRLMALLLPCAALSLRPTPRPASNHPHRIFGRRSALGLGWVATHGFTPLTAQAYDSVKSAEPTFEELEKKRLARRAQMESSRKRVKPYLDALTSAADGKSFAKAADDLSLWLIGEGKLPEGLDASLIRDLIQDAYKALPMEKYYCEETRTNQGICFTPGPAAEDAYKAVIRELRKASSSKGKGALMSDGVSAANSAAF